MNCAAPRMRQAARSNQSFGMPLNLQCAAAPPPVLGCALKSMPISESMMSESDDSDSDMGCDLLDYDEMEICEESKSKPKATANNTPVTLNSYQIITNAQHPSGYWCD